MILPMLKEAWISIKSNKLRSSLTILGIVIGVCAVVLIVAVGQAVQNEINSKLETLGGNMMIVTPGASTKGGVRRHGIISTLTIGDAEAIKQLRNVTEVAPAVASNVQVVNGSKNWNTTIVGSNLDYINLGDWEIIEGTEFVQRDIETGIPYILIGHTVRKELFEEDENPIGQDIRIRNTPFTVIGVLKERGSGITGEDQDDIIIAPLKVVKTRIMRNRFPNQIRVILLTVDERENMVFVEKRITKLLRERHKIRDDKEKDFSITNITEIANKISSVGFMLSVLLAVIASISLVVGSIGIMNMMLVSVTERTREIGIRKAVGAPNKSIMLQFLLEAILISFIGSLIGMVLGIGLSQIGGAIVNKPVPISVLTIFISIGVAIMVGIASGFFPALKATRLDPIEALRYQ